jgi:hypothetical protein
MSRMGKFLRTGGLVVLILSMLMSLSACSKSPEDILAEAQKNMADVTSMSYSMDMSMEMGTEEFMLGMDMVSTADYIIDPLTLKLDLSMDMGELGSTSQTMYTTLEGDTYISYFTVDDGATWYKQEVASTEELERYNAQNTMELYLSSMENFEENGTETINGSKATRYDGVISKEYLKDVMEISGVLSQFESFGLDSSSIDLETADFGEMPISVWIDEESVLPVKYEMDMTSFMQNMMDVLLTTLMAEGESTETLTIGEVFVSMTLTNLNGVEQIEIPPEALAAEPMTY